MSFVRWLVVFICCTVCSTVWADDDSVAQAKVAFGRAETAYHLGHFAEAAAGYADAYRLAPSPPLLFNLAQAWRRHYETTSDLKALRIAYDTYRDVIRDVPIGGLRDLAEKEVTKLRSALVDRESGEAALRFADKLMAEQFWPEAAHLLDRQLQVGKLTPAQMFEVFNRRATVAAAMNTPDEATKFYLKALNVDARPALLQRDSAAQQSAAAAATSAFQQAGGFRVRHHPLATFRDPAAAMVTLTIEQDPLSLIAAGNIYYRLPASPNWIALPLVRSSGLLQIKLPALELAGLKAGEHGAYFAQVLDEHENELLLLGSADRPFSFTRTFTKPWYKRPWVWATIGAAAVAVGVGVGVGVYYATKPSTPALVYPAPTL